MKRRRYIQILLALMVTLIIGGTMFVNSPRTQQRASVWAATELENYIGTRVAIGGIHWLLPGDIIIDNLRIDDQEGEPLISIDRLAAKIEWMPLLRHKQVSVRNVRLFSPDINIYRTGDEYNYQFLIDALASKKEREREPSQLSLRINSLLVRHGKACHQIDLYADEDSEPAAPSFAERLCITDFSTQLSLKHLSADSASLIIRHLDLKEESGLKVEHLYLRLVGNRHGATLANFQFDLPQSSLRLDTIWTAYSLDIPRDAGSPTLPRLTFKGGILPASHITPTDLAWIIPEVGGIDEKVYLGARFSGSPANINVTALDVHSSQHDLALRADAQISHNDNHTSGARGLMSNNLSLTLHEASLTKHAWTILEQGAPELFEYVPQELINIGDLTMRGELNHDERQSQASFRAKTEAGALEGTMTLDKTGDYTATLRGDTLHIAQIVPLSPLTHTNLKLESRGALNIGNQSESAEKKPTSIIKSASLSGALTDVMLLDYEYRRLNLNGHITPDSSKATLSLDDPCGGLALQGKILHQKSPLIEATLHADSLDLNEIGLIDIHEGKTFSASIRTNLEGTNIEHVTGRIIVDSLTMHRPTGDYRIGEIGLYISDIEDKMFALQSEFMNATARGAFTYSSLASSLLHHLHHSLPSLCHSNIHDHQESDNLCYINASIYNTQPLRELLFIPIDIEGKVQMEALINDPAGELKLTAIAPQIDYDGNTIKSLSLDCQSQEEGLIVHAGATLLQGIGGSITANVATRAEHDKVSLGVVWNSNPTGMFEGTFHTQATFGLDHNGRLGINIKADSTRTVINNSEWQLSSFGLDITPERISIDRLHLEGDSTQHLSAHGTIANNEADTLKVDFMGLDLAYLLQLVKFEAIPFGGRVSGHADMANLHTEQPYINANIMAKDFTFSHGDMGNLRAQAHWDQENSQLRFLGDVWEDTLRTSLIDGTLDLANEELWLDIEADSLNASFLNNMLSSFMSQITGHASGNITIGGPITEIDLMGALLADMDFTLSPTNTKYHFRDSIRFTPGVMHFNNIDIYDEREQKGIIRGTVNHDKLREFACDLYVDIQNVLGIDLPDTGHDSFYTTIYGTGGVHVIATPTTLDIDIQAQPERGSLFALNIAGKDDTSNQKFITFTDRSSTRNVPTIATRTRGKRRRAQATTEGGSMLDLDITARVTPDAMLKLVMNQAVDDHITVYGSGDLQISVKGDDISLLGTYTVSHGFYRLSLQDVINKNFDVLPGSTVSFEGDPMAAKLNITARHAANYVPLRDLRPDMNGNAVVNCLLRIGGTLESPTVTFDLELPKGTEEEKALLRSYTSTEEQMNMQFIYLLGLGKFYTPDMAQNAQGTGNVESFISNTISGQINNLLSGIISSDNWNIASNIRAENMMTGMDDLGGDNWENMEIEGILEGRLLDNRLLINGNFGYRENPMYATNFIGDFDIRYLLTGGLSVKGYNKTNDRYFSRTSLTTQGVGLIFQRDFDRLWPRRKRKRKKIENLTIPVDTISAVTDSLINIQPTDSTQLIINLDDKEHNQ